MKVLKIILISFGVIAFLVFSFGGGKEEYAKTQLNKIENQVANDAVQQYNICKRAGNKMDIYVHAGLCKAAFLQANDEVNYNIWDSIEKADARAAGMNLDR